MVVPEQRICSECAQLEDHRRNPHGLRLSLPSPGSIRPIIRIQNEHGSHSWIPKVLHIRQLITFTPDPPSTIVPGTSRPLMMAVIVGLLVSTTANPSSRFEKNVGAGAGLGGANADFKPSVNRGTNCSNRPSGSMIWHSRSACHAGFSCCIISVGSSDVFLYSCSSVTFCSFAFRSILCLVFG